MWGRNVGTATSSDQRSALSTALAGASSIGICNFHEDSPSPQATHNRATTFRYDCANDSHCSAHAVRRPCGLRDIADVADVIVGCACCLPRADTGERELAGTHKQRLLCQLHDCAWRQALTDRRRLLGVPRPYLRLLSDVCLPGYLTSNGSRILCYLEEGAKPAAGSAGAHPVGRPHGPRPGFSDETKAGGPPRESCSTAFLSEQRGATSVGGEISRTKGGVHAEMRFIGSACECDVDDGRELAQSG
jgi:hypothetical protein